MGDVGVWGRGFVRTRQLPHLLVLSDHYLLIFIRSLVFNKFQWWTRQQQITCVPVHSFTQRAAPAGEDDQAAQGDGSGAIVVLELTHFCVCPRTQCSAAAPSPEDDQQTAQGDASGRGSRGRGRGGANASARGR
mgnify:CR=1 FL=1